MKSNQQCWKTGAEKWCVENLPGTAEAGLGLDGSGGGFPFSVGLAVAGGSNGFLVFKGDFVAMSEMKW